MLSLSTMHTYHTAIVIVSINPAKESCSTCLIVGKYVPQQTSAVFIDVIIVYRDPYVIIFFNKNHRI